MRVLSDFSVCPRNWCKTKIPIFKILYKRDWKQGGEGGRVPLPPYLMWPFQYYICLHFPSSGNLHSTLHCIALTQTKRLRKEIDIYSDSHQYASKLCLIKYCIKYPCFPFWKVIILFVVSLQKWLIWTFLASERMEKWRFQRYIGHATL